MEIKNQGDAIKLIFELQKAISEKAGKSITSLFGYTVNEETGKLNLTAKGSYYMSSKKHEMLIFEGKSLEEATQNFFNYFVSGGEAQIDKDVSGEQLKTNFIYEKDHWLIKSFEISWQSWRE